MDQRMMVTITCCTLSFFLSPSLLHWPRSSKSHVGWKVTVNGSFPSSPEFVLQKGGDHYNKSVIFTHKETISLLLLIRLIQGWALTNTIASTNTRTTVADKASSRTVLTTILETLHVAPHDQDRATHNSPHDDNFISMMDILHPARRPLQLPHVRIQSPPQLVFLPWSQHHSIPSLTQRWWPIILVSVSSFYPNLQTTPQRFHV